MIKLISIMLCMAMLALVVCSEDKKKSGWKPKILKSSSKKYLPDFSYAGYQWGEKPLPKLKPTASILDFGAVPDDGKDDTSAIKKAIASLSKGDKPVVLFFPKGKYIIKQIIYIERSNFVIQGAGCEKGGTTFYMPNAMNKMDLSKAKGLLKTKAYLIKANKRDGKGNLYSLFSWSGGIFWVRLTKDKLNKKFHGKIIAGKQGSYEIKVGTSKGLKKGDVIVISWYNRDGRSGSFLKHAIGTEKMKVGGRLYENPKRSIVQQFLTVKSVGLGKIITKEPLLHNMKKAWNDKIETRTFLKNIGIENIYFSFPKRKYGGHHSEEGFNAIRINNVQHSWVRNIRVRNADTGVGIGSSKNITVQDIKTSGRGGHYSVMIGVSNHILVKDFSFRTDDCHGPSFNSQAVLNVYTNGSSKYGRLDQHCALNAQNLFDRLVVSNGDELFVHGGGQNAYPTAGKYNTFWNLRVKSVTKNKTLTCLHAPGARIIGMHVDKGKIKLNYQPKPYIEGLNKRNISVPSLYEYQLKKRLSSKKK